VNKELEEAIKLFGREDLLGDYGIQDIDTSIEVFLSVKDMIKFYKQGKEIERLNTNLEVANEDLTRIAQLLNLEEGCTIYDIEDEIERLKNIINSFDKWLLGEQMMFYKSSDGETLIRFNETTSKWLELKGADKD